jgi:hypothetical protein
MLSTSKLISEPAKLSTAYLYQKLGLVQSLANWGYGIDACPKLTKNRGTKGLTPTTRHDGWQALRIGAPLSVGRSHYCLLPSESSGGSRSDD